jgi:hypothetical protein
VKIYIAARYERREEMIEVDRRLRELGHEPTSRWVLGGELNKPERFAAEMDIEDLFAANALLFFAGDKGGGGRYCELGMAIAIQRLVYGSAMKFPIFVVGEQREMVFLHLREPTLYTFPTLNDALKVLSKWEQSHRRV